MTNTNESKLTIDEKTAALFQYDPLLPAQYFETLRSTRPAPEKLLMLAVLEDALTCIQKYAARAKGKEKRWFRETMEWVATEDDDWPFSFTKLCEAIGLDANGVRQALLRMAESEALKLSAAKSGRDRRSRRKGRRDRIVRAAA